MHGLKNEQNKNEKHCLPEKDSKFYDGIQQKMNECLNSFEGIKK